MVCMIEISSSYLLAMTKGVRFVGCGVLTTPIVISAKAGIQIRSVGWISEAHPPKKKSSFYTKRSAVAESHESGRVDKSLDASTKKNSLRHSARSEAELQNLMSKQKS